MLRFKTEGIIRNSYNENDLIFRFSKKIKKFDFINSYYVFYQNIIKILKYLVHI